MMKSEISVSNLANLKMFRIWKIWATHGGKTMHPGRLIMVINVSDNFYSYYKAVESNLPELFFSNLMNKFKIIIFNAMAFLPHFQML